jgi:hypothetical protein
MISQEDSRRTIRISERRMMVLPTVTEYKFSIPEGEAINLNQAYASDTNTEWMTIEDLRRYIEELD